MSSAIISQCLDIIIEILLIHLLFSYELVRSKARYAFCAFCSVFSLMYLYFFFTEDVLVIVDIIITLIIVCTLISGKWYEKSIAFLLIYTMISLVYQGIAITINIILGFPIFFGLGVDDNRIFFKAITIIILFIVIFAKRHKHFYFRLSLANKTFLFLLSFVTTFLISFLRFNQGNINSGVLNAILLIGFTVICILILYLYSASQNNYQTEQNHMQSQYIHTLKAYYTTLESNEKEIRKIRHDMKNHIRILNGLIESEKYKEAQEYIHQIDDFTTRKIHSNPNVGNPLINAVLLQKSMEYSSINIELKGSASKNLPISDYDICTIISNLLDNALEHSKDNHFDKVEFYIYQENSILFIIIANQLAETINIKQIGKHSTKTGKEHGYGIDNIKEAVHRNHGKFQYEQKNNKLYAKVQLYLHD